MRFSSFCINTLLSTSLLLSLIGCGSNIVRESNSAEGRYKYGIALIEDDRFEEAIVELEDVKNKFPYSRFSTLSKLAIADIHFRRESYIEAQSAYEIFKSLHPKHIKSDFVTYRLGLSFFKQLPSTIDRDLSIARKAILYFDQLTRYYPSSIYVKEAKEKKAEALKMLAEKELYIANFYYKQEKYSAALNRYEIALNTYSGLGFDSRFLFGAASSSYRSGNLKKGKKYLDQLTQKHPNSDETEKAKEEATEYAKP